ncbi:MAG: O-antigen ligase family protein [Patescibacteria group bacterium]
MEWFAVILWLSVLVIVSWRTPEYGVYILAATTPLYLVRLSLVGLPTTLLELELLVLAGVVVLKYRYALLGACRVRTRIEKALAVSIIAFVISASVSVVVSPDMRAALGIWRAYILEPLLFFIIIISVITTPQQIRRMVVVCGIGAVIIALVSIAQVLTGYGIPEPWAAERRATSFFPYPNAVGLYLAPLIPLVVALAAGRGRITQKAALGVVGILLVGIAAAQTTGALVALAVTGVIGGVLWSKTSRQWVLRVIVVGALIATITPVVRDQLVKKLSFNTWSGTVRQIMWGETLPMLRDHWFTGAGLAGYQKAFEPYHKAKAIEIFLYPHSIVLNFWSELGLYGLISVVFLVAVYFVLLVFARSRENRALVYGLGGAMIVILVHGSVDVPYFKNDLAIMWWMFFALALILYRQRRAAL